jgi:hypothetical protein
VDKLRPSLGPSVLTQQNSMGCGSSSSAVDQRSSTAADQIIPDSAVEPFDNGHNVDVEALNGVGQAQNSAVDWEWKAAENKRAISSEQKLDPENKPRLQIAEFDPNTNMELQDFEETEFDVGIVQKAPALEKPELSLNQLP